MTKKEKVLNFVKEHKTAIVGGLGVAAGGLITTVVFCKYFGDKVVITDKGLGNFMLNANRKYDIKTVYLDGIDCDIELKPEQLGELGQRMLNKFDVPADYTFTHFICIGDGNKNK